jgi:hypothetical protein
MFFIDVYKFKKSYFIKKLNKILKINIFLFANFFWHATSPIIFIGEKSHTG